MNSETNAGLSMDATKILPEYFSGAPSNQSAVDIFKGHWVSSFPDEFQATTGGSPLFNPLYDTRVQWVAGVYDFKGKSILELDILELGPLEQDFPDVFLEPCLQFLAQRN